MACAADLLEGSLSFTQLLNMDLDALEDEEEEEEEPPPKPATTGRSGGHAGPDGIAEVPTRPRTRRGVPPAAASSVPSPAARTVQASQVTVTTAQYTHFVLVTAPLHAVLCCGGLCLAVLCCASPGTIMSV